MSKISFIITSVEGFGIQAVMFSSAANKLKAFMPRNSRPVMRISIVMAVIVLVFISSSAQAQAPGIVGIDHVGINVPDLQQAVNFFHNMFGFQPVTKLGPFTMDANWKNNYHIHEKSGDVTLVMMRAGDGSNIELFEYEPGAGNTEQPFRDDASATHISLYTSDIKGAKTYLESKGVKFLTDINSGVADTEGESWVYFVTPWGATIELNSYPDGKGYEKHNPAVKLWKASSLVELTVDETITKENLQALASKQVEIWNDTDEKNRLPKMKDIYQDNVSFYDHESVVNGLESLNERITKLQHKNINFKFSLIKIDNSNNVVRYYWNYGPASSPELIAGMDLIILENNKIRSLHIFLDRLPSQAQK